QLARSGAEQAAQLVEDAAEPALVLAAAVLVVLRAGGGGASEDDEHRCNDHNHVHGCPSGEGAPQTRCRRAQCAPRKSSSRRLKTSGRSYGVACPEAGTASTRAPGMARARPSLAPRGTTRSRSPATTSVGHRTAASCARASKRDSARMAAAYPRR